MTDLIIYMITWTVLGLILYIVIAARIDEELYTSSTSVKLDYSKFKSKKKLVLWLILCGPLVWVGFFMNFLWEIFCWLGHFPFAFLDWLIGKTTVFFLGSEDV